MKIVSGILCVLLIGVLACASDPSEGEARQRVQERVQEAIDRYDTEGRDALLDYYRSEASIQDESYVFVLSHTGEILATPRVEREDYPEDVRTLIDSEGYNFGPDLLDATKRGTWIFYQHENPVTGEIQTKHTWLVMHQGLIFGSGWYE